MVPPVPPPAWRSRPLPGAVLAGVLPGILLLLGWSGWSAPVPRGAGDLTGAWQLLVDDSLVVRKEHIRRTYHPFAKHAGNPVLVADQPWEGRMAYLYGTVLPEASGTGYRMWYHAWAGEYRNLYATSQDGVAWTKPDLGLIEFNGARANNIFLRRTKEDHLPQVIHTPWETSAGRRYKLINYDYGRSGPGHDVSGFWGAYSPDGLHWTDVAENPVLKDPGDVGQFVWDPHRQRYLGYPKVFAPVRGYRRRCVGFTATRDFAHWPSAQLVLTPDEEDDRWAMGKHQRTEFYGLSGFAYESAYLGFLWIFRVTDGQNDGPIYPELVSSRDGIRWTRQDPLAGGRVPILPLGAGAAWDRGMIFTPSQPLVEGGLVKLWYGGVDITHGGPDAQARGGIGLATLRKDGFASLDAGAVEGVITTHPLKHLRGPLRLNADARGGAIKVEVLTANGQVRPGYGRDACDAISGDAIDQPVTWGRRKELPVSSEPQSLRFVLQNASLYSFAAGAQLAVAEPDPAPLCQLHFEGVLASTKLTPREQRFRPPNEAADAAYVLYEPAIRPASGRSPLLIYLCGAGGSLEDYNLMRPPYDRLRDRLALQGYYILVPELGPLHWMNADAQRRLDLMLEHVLAQHPIDPLHVQVMGTSMGGGSALAYAIRHPDRIRAVCSHLGMTDFAQWIQESPRFAGTVSQAYGGTPDRVPTVFRQQSAMANLDAFSNVPVFLIAGETDQTVLPRQGRQLADALWGRGYSAMYREAPGIGHEDRSIVGFEDELAEFFGRTAGSLPAYQLRGGVQLVSDAVQAAFGSGAARFPAGDAARASRIELLGTAHLGPQFTLAAQVKSPAQKLMRLFSNHRGSGEFVTGELVFDFDPSGTAIPGLRFVANGQAVLSRPATFAADRPHHLAVTYDRGRVTLYVDGAEVGAGWIQPGAAHLAHDRTVQRCFDEPDALPEVGLHLGSNLFVGSDADATFVTYQDAAAASRREQLTGFVDEILVVRAALTARNIRRLAREGFDLRKVPL